MVFPEPMYTRQDIIEADDAGSLLETIAATPYAQFDSAVRLLSGLHNCGDIDFLASCEPPPLAALSDHSFFALQRVFCQTLPHIDCSAEAAASACESMFARAGNDGTAGLVYGSLSEWFRQSPSRAEEGLALIHRHRDTHRRLVRPVLLAGPTHDASKYVEEAFNLSNDSHSPVRLDALWALGQIVPAENEPFLTRTIERFNELVDALVSDEDTAIVVEAALNLLHRTDGGIVNAVEPLFEKASRNHAPATRHALATGLLRHRDHYSQAMTDAVFAALQHTINHESHTAKTIDWLLYQWDLDADRKRVLAFLVKLFTQGDDALDLQTLSDFRHQLRGQPGDVLGWYVVSLLLTGEHALCTAAQSLLPFNETRDGLDIDLSSFSLPPRWIPYLARKILGYCILNKESAAALLLSCLRAVPERNLEELEELVFRSLSIELLDRDGLVRIGRFRRRPSEAISRAAFVTTAGVRDRTGSMRDLPRIQAERTRTPTPRLPPSRLSPRRSQEGRARLLTVHPRPQGDGTLRHIGRRLRSEGRRQRAPTTGSWHGRPRVFIRVSKARRDRSGRLAVQHPPVPVGAPAIMKLIFTQYLASLKERGELDVIMPDLLSEIGLSVISRPARGTKQHGVDVAAVGTLPRGVRSLYLISIKPGDLRRSGWNTGEQSLRTSLDQILDVYIEKLKPKRYKGLPVVVVLCLGGDLHEDVRDDVNGYMDRNATGGITFELWNGDALAELLLTGVLAENALPATWRSDLRKSVALVDEPEVSFRHFSRFLNGIVDQCRSTRRARLTAVRQIYLALWTLYVWARGADNIEAAYRCSERAMLIGWTLVKGHLLDPPKQPPHIRHSMERLITLHHTIADDYLASYVKPRAKILNGLASAVPSQASLDINLRLFDILGRVGTRGLWQLHAFQVLELNRRMEEAQAVREQLHGTAMLLADILNNNPILCTPIKDNQAIDINIACLFLNRVGCNQVIQNWIQQTAKATVFAYHSNTAYPCVFLEYRDLVDHPMDTPDYRLEATSASLLLPTLAVWAAVTGDGATLDGLANFVSGHYQHSNLQLWYPGSDTEENLYRGSADHGLFASSIKIERTCEGMLAPIKSECALSAAYCSLSALQHGLWPLLVSASRHHRHPVPPHLWPL